MNKKLSKIISDYFKNKDEVIAVYLFGSYASENNQPFSDIDIGILLNLVDQKFANQQKIRYMTELSRILRKDIHPVILNSASEVLMKQIYSKGKCILIKDSKELAKYKMTMYARIADFAYYLDKMQKGFIRRTMEE
jgi:predicted nucleotidyltransferase